MDNDRRKKTRRNLEEIYNLPAMSKMIMEISKMLDDPRTNNSTLEKMISKDPGIASKILSISNSPLYGLRRKVSTIDFAILVIGFAEMKSIVLALSIMEALNIKSGQSFEHVEFWNHSTIMGAASRRLSDDLGFSKGGEALVVGLLHDMGIGIIYKYFRQEFDKIIKDVKEKNITYKEAEIENLGYTHQEIGATICENWNLPESLCEAILYHQTPSLAPNDKIIPSIVHLADYLTNKFKLGGFYWDENFKFDEKTIDFLKFESQENLDKFIDGYKNLFEEELENIKVVLKE